MISEILYFVFVFPLESILGFGLERIFGIVKSYGLSIIILSLFVNIFLLKIFILTDKKAEFESMRKKRLDSRIKAWKSVYKKAKLFAFTQTLYRQNHYHPIFALSALGGLAVQIPFFYAMYFVVKNTTLNGESFLWISDLSAPDLILGVHLLPILMTIISLINVWIVAKEKGARIQGIAIALIFLVLLYKMPSALVLYWTSNMAFSLIRALAKFRFGNSPLDKHSARLMTNFGLTDSSSSELAITNATKLFFIFRKPLKIAVISLTLILAIGLIITISLMLYAKDNVQTSPLSLEYHDKARIHFGKWDFLLRSSTISNVKLVDIAWDKAIDSTDIKVTNNAKRFVYFEYIDFRKGTNLGQIQYTMDFTPLFKNLFIYYFAILGAMLGIYLLLCVILHFQPYHESYAQTYLKITNCAILCIAFLICVFNPYALYATDITQFDHTQTIATLSALFGAFLVVSFIAIYLISFIPKRFAQIPAFIFSLTLFIGLIYSFILVGDYGAMDHFVLQKAPESSLWQILEFIAVLTLGVALVAFTLTKLMRVLQIAFATLFIVSGVNAFQIIDKRLDSQLSSLQEVRSDSKQSTKSHNDISAPPICPTQNLAFFPTPNPTKISLLSCLICLVAHIYHIS